MTNKKENEEFEQIVLNIKNALSNLTIEELDNGSDYKKTFYIKELKQEFLLEHSLPDNVEGKSKLDLKIYNFVFSMYKYTFEYGKTFLNCENKTCNEFTQSIITHIAKKYELHLHRNSDEYKKFIDNINKITGDKSIILEDNTILNKKILEKIQLTENILLLYVIPQKSPYIIMNFSPNEKTHIYAEFKTQMDVLEYLKQFKSSKMGSVE